MLNLQDSHLLQDSHTYPLLLKSELQGNRVVRNNPYYYDQIIQLFTEQPHLILFLALVLLVTAPFICMVSSQQQNTSVANQLAS